MDKVADGIASAPQGHQCPRTLIVLGALTNARCVIVRSEGVHMPACHSRECKANRAMPKVIMEVMARMVVLEGKTCADAWLMGTNMLKTHKAEVQRTLTEAVAGRVLSWERTHGLPSPLCSPRGRHCALPLDGVLMPQGTMLASAPPDLTLPPAVAGWSSPSASSSSSSSL